MIRFTYPGPELNVCYHNHSSWSDGGTPLEEVCRTAKKIGLKEFGLSDHWVVPPKDGMNSEVWSMRLDRLDEYVTTLQGLKKELEDETFSLKMGLEVDFFYENADSVLDYLSKFPLDYLIGSVHYADIFPIDHSIEPWIALSEEEKKNICEIYWKKLEGAAARKEFSFIGHLDLPKKFGMINNDDYIAHAVRVLDIVQKTGIGIELNTAGWFKECEEQYPSLTILKEANARKIPVIVNADAHDPAHLQRNFEKAAEILVQAGYPARSL
jgi:histidinol-phosphatase (PHP family)